MLPDTRTMCCPHVAHLCGFAACGFQHIMAVAEHLKTVTDTLPDDLKPIGQALADFTMQALIESYAETLKLISDLGIQKIAQAGIPPTPHTEPDLLKRRNSNGI
jgi:hypothetical protein